MKQRTLKSEISFEGIGLHTGHVTKICVKPLSVNKGYVFKRVDLEGEPEIKALAENVTSTERGTTISKGDASISTIEHLLAAIHGLEIDNALIEINGPEVPIMDGSSMPFIEEIEKAGIVDQDADRVYLVIDKNIAFEEDGVEFLAVPTDTYRLTVMVDYNSPVLGTQHATIMDLNEFKEDIASARTFCFLNELEYLAKNNLIKGGDLDNAVVLVEREHVSQEELDSLAKLLGKEKLNIKFSGIGTLNSSDLRFENEPARHKLLDIVGDLALVGKFIKGHILAARPGHAGNTSFAKVLRNYSKEQDKAPKKFDLTKEPLYDINQISAILPHRYPFLLVDKIIDIGEDFVVGVKNITMNEPYFQGHFPNNPVMPGVLQLEAMAQVGGIFALSTVDEPEKWSTYFLKIDDVKFKKKVLPGDTIVMELKLQRPIRRGLVHMKGTTYVNGVPASQSDMLAQIVKEIE
jgi:UDP-3-O-[3-hydroxymyristoyl] N-acetylglucosamine deacetylase / 3-hydroxyacyl-[acyl-carrier-protein] dehydratase